MFSSIFEFVVPIVISITCNKSKNNKIFSRSASVVCRLLLLHYCGTAGVAFDLIKNRSYLPHFVAGLMLTSTLCCCSGQRAPSTQVGHKSSQQQAANRLEASSIFLLLAGRSLELTKRPVIYDFVNLVH